MCPQSPLIPFLLHRMQKYSQYNIGPCWVYCRAMAGSIEGPRQIKFLGLREKYQPHMVQCIGVDL